MADANRFWKRNLEFAVAAAVLLALSIASAQVPPPSPTPEAQAPAATTRVSGRLFERGTKRPLSDVNVFLLPAKLKATTDAQGRFVFDAAPLGDVQFVVNAAGFQRLDRAETLANGESRERVLFLERQSYQGLETTVVGRAEKRDDTTRSLKTEQFLTLPGSGGDPVKAVQNLPGVARATAGSSQVIIQGSAPQDTRYLIDDQEVPLVFHFGGLTSVITPEAVGQVDYLSAGYGPEYGRAMGGLVGLKTREPDRERTKGFAFLDTTKAGGLIEGPINENSSYWFTARYSYLGAVLKAVLKDQDEFDLTVAPSFGDVAGLYQWKPNDRDEFRLLTIGSRDELKFLLKEPVREDPALRGEFSNETMFYRVIPQWTRRHEGGSITRVSAGVGQDWIRVNAGENFFDLSSARVSQRAEHEKKLSEEWTSILGVDNQVIRSRVKLRIPTTFNAGGVNNPISTGEPEDRNVTREDFLLGTYWRNTVKATGSRWTLMPSARIDYFNSTEEVLPVPRFAARFDETASTFWRAAGGIYFQPPEPQETDAVLGNPDIKSPRAWHLAFGREQDFREGSSRGFVLSTGVFYRYFDNLVVDSNRLVTRNGTLAPERYNNDGTGDAYGAEIQLRLEAAPWTGWIAYTVSESVRREPGTRQYPFRYDQTHNFNIVGAVDLKKNWRISARARYVTGNPSTPIVGGIYDTDNDVYIPVRGAFYSERLDPFLQLDARVDRKWIYDKWILWAYLDIQNITNAKNEEGIRYAYDYSDSRKVTGLPILPTFGLRGDF